MIKTIFFDLGNVLIPFDYRRGYAALEGLCRFPAVEIQRRVGSSDLAHRFESGLIEAEAFFHEFSALLELKIGYGRFCEIWNGVFYPDPNIPESMLAALKKRYRLVLLSNTNAIHFKMLWETYPLLRQFHALVLSHEVQAMKPLAKIYQAALAKAGCEPGECFYTDDIPAYVEGARAHGIDAVQFHSREQLEKEMRARGIEW